MLAFYSYDQIAQVYENRRSKCDIFLGKNAEKAQKPLINKGDFSSQLSQSYQS